MRICLIIVSAFIAGCCSLCPGKIIEVPVAVPYPNVAMPIEPDYPILTEGSTPRQTMEFCAQKLIGQEGYIKQLQEIISGLSSSKNTPTASKNDL